MSAGPRVPGFQVNLPNAITLGRIFAAPFVGWLPLAPSWTLRLLGFILFVIVAVSDYYDGMLARTRNAVTDLGKQLDPLADKLFLIATLVPMFVLMNFSAHVDVFETRTGITLPAYQQGGLWFVTPFAKPFEHVGLPIWVVVIILGREVAVTWLRARAARRGVVVAAIPAAKWKTGFQLVWVGSAYFWFWVATAARKFEWSNPLWQKFALFNGTVGVLTMFGAVALTVYTLVIYIQHFRALNTQRTATSTR